MGKLNIPVSSVTMQGVSIEAEVSPEDIRPEGMESLPVERVSVSGVLSALPPHILFRGRISGNFAHFCDRCLEAARAPFNLEIVWDLEEGPPRDWLQGVRNTSDEVEEAVMNTARRTFQGDEIDLGPHVWEEVLFAVPGKYLCSEDCKGLCQRCGTNLNEGACRCAATEPEALSSGLSGLAEMFPDLAEEQE